MSDTATDGLTRNELGRIFAEPAAYADPVAWHAAAKRLREETPIARVSIPKYQDFWAITRNADIKEIGRHPEVFHNAPTPTLALRADWEAGGTEQGAAVQTLVQMDGDDHRDHRNVVNEWFKPANVRRMNDRVAELAKSFVDRMAGMGGECDFSNDIAMHYPLQVILSTLGLPEEDHARMLKLTQELFGAEDPDIGRAGEDATVMQVMLDFVTYFTTLAGDRRAHPTEDLASVIANAQLHGAPLPDMDVMGYYLIIATAGHDTTSNSIAGGVLALLENPDQLELLRANPELVENAADELIRYVSPVKHFVRHVQAPFTLHDVTFQQGDTVLLSYASGNRDEEVFDDPFKLDVRRENAAAHVGLGFGRHFCLGAHLARLEIRAFFRELISRLDSIELAGEPTFVHSNLVSGPKTLPIRYQLR